MNKYEKYSDKNPAHLFCIHFTEDESGRICCDSCHEDVALGYPLVCVDHPLNKNIIAEVCCRVQEEYLDRENNDPSLVYIWEKALTNYEAAKNEKM